MADFNSVTISGRLGADPDVRYFESGNSVAKLRLAVTEYYNGNERTSWIAVEAWGKTCEIITNCLQKGSRAGFEGRLKEEAWTTDGVKRSKLVVVAQRVILMGSSRKTESTEAESNVPEEYAETAPVGDDCPF